ncbi:capsid cement protein [Antrihabitans sp. NCIMB 15449]|uniref:Capsid cement protein n=1 Tax=Antrihabitans spumae TaxID=3373370 RepID=A0ABW7JLV1_9NOCA
MSTTINIYAPGGDITGQATGTVTAKRALKISGNRTGGNVAVAPADAAGRIFGVAADDAAVGELVAVARGSGRVVKVTAGGTIAAFAEVEVGTGGKVVTKTSGVAVGYALTGATLDTDAEISLA